MDINLPFIEYYPPGDAMFIDPMYVPYLRKDVPMDDQGCRLEVNTWKHMGNPNYVNEAHYRREWNKDFKKIHPNDPCPAGFGDAGNGYCIAIREEAHSSDFYTDKRFAVKYQYFDGYTIDSKKEMQRRPVLRNQDDAPTFKAASNNPHTGRFVVYHDPMPSKNTNKYGKLPTRASYLGFQ